MVESTIHSSVVSARSLLAAATILAAVGCAHEVPTPAPLIDSGGAEISGNPRPDISAPVVLVSGQAGPAAIAVDRENVYWKNIGTSDGPHDTKLSALYTGGQVLKCAIRGCAGHPTVLASGREVSGGIPSLAFALDGGDVYWADEGPIDGQLSSAIFRCSANGCNDSPTVIGPGAYALALHKGRIYWNLFQASVSSCTSSDCMNTKTSLWSAGFSPVVTAIAVDASGVYWATGATDSIRKCALDGCENNPLVLDPADPISVDLRHIAIDSDNVYVADGNPAHSGMILKCPKSGCVGAPSVLADRLNSPNAIATDGIHVYWAEAGDQLVDGQPVTNAGAIRKCAVDGCGDSPATIASSIDPVAIAVDDALVYWAASDGTIMMAPK
jgi:hypothetical protein